VFEFQIESYYQHFAFFSIHQFLLVAVVIFFDRLSNIYPSQIMSNALPTIYVNLFCLHKQTLLFPDWN